MHMEFLERSQEEGVGEIKITPGHLMKIISKHFEKKIEPMEQ